ncbi:MAG: hypothetical protein AB2693_13555 [Candidatus Thiodiazotropha sp.]
MITNDNTVVADTERECFEQDRHRKKLWVTIDVLDLCDERRALKSWYKAE